jgi:transcriptional regulator with XRE-family HTH domain
MNSMNDAIRETVKNRMKSRELTQRELAKRTDMHETNLARLLAGRSGTINQSWQRVLEELNLELVAVPKGTDLSKLLEEKGR